MFMHDHSGEKERTDRYCPIMKEICHAGWTESMGESKETKRRPTCKAWQPVTVINPMAQPPQSEVYDCSVFGWTTDLMVQAANETYKVGAATEEVRNHIAEQNGASRIMLGFFQGIAKRLRAPMIMFEPPAKKQIENGKGAGHE